MVKIRWISFRDVFTCERTDTRDQEKFLSGKTVKFAKYTFPWRLKKFHRNA